MLLKAKTPLLVSLAVVLPTLWVIFTRQSFWPFFTYPMYSVPINRIETNSYEVRATLGKKKFPLTSYKVLGPTGSNGLAWKLESLVSRSNKDKPLKNVLKYFAFKYHQAYGSQLDAIELILRKKSQNDVKSIWVEKTLLKLEFESE